MDSENKKNTSIKGTSRRGFIKKSSVVAGISILPASNVWGVCNASSGSGGSQSANGSCTVNYFSGGYAPSFWQNLTKYSPDAADTEELTKVLSNVDTTDNFSSHPKAPKAEFYYPLVATMLNTSNLKIAGSANIPFLSINVGHVLSNYATQSSNTRSIAALYANLLFGLVNVETQFTGPDGSRMFLEHVWGSLHVGDNSQTLAVINGSYTGGSISEDQLTSILKRSNML